MFAKSTPSSIIERSRGPIAPSSEIFGIENVPFSNLLYHIAKPSPSQYNNFMLLPLRLRNTKRWPDMGLCFTILTTIPANASKLLRMSVGSTQK